MALPPAPLPVPMSPLDLLNHLLNLFAPALAVALGLASAACWTLGRGPGRPAWWKQVLLIATAGALVLLAGLVLAGRDGRMATYVALVGVCATVQWLLLRGWQR